MGAKLNSLFLSLLPLAGEGCQGLLAPLFKKGASVAAADEGNLIFCPLTLTLSRLATPSAFIGPCKTIRCYAKASKRERGQEFLADWRH
jgi:hypothetical protein